MSDDLKLTVGGLSENRQDYGKGIARLSSNFMIKLGIREGEYIEVEGKKKTYLIAIRSYPSDVGLDIIRIDGISRKNCQTGVGERVKVRRAELTEAKKITIAPAQKGVMVRIDPGFISQNLYKRPVSKGDLFVPTVMRKRDSEFLDDFFDNFFGENVRSFNPLGDIQFVVVDVSPKEGGFIGEATHVEIISKAVEVKEEESISGVTYDDLGGLKREIDSVREVIELPLRHNKPFEILGVKPPKGVLLHGPPGTGKTLLAKAVANESGAKFYPIAGPEIMSKWYGQSEENLRKIFDEAEKNAPSIIFIDEIDAIAPKREEVSGEVERRVVSQLLTIMDGLKTRGQVIVIGATNRPDSLDPALRRPGRFDREIVIGIPNSEGRLEILQIHSRNMPIKPDYTKSEILKVIETEKDAKTVIEKIKKAEKKKLVEILKEEKMYDKVTEKLRTLLLKELSEKTYGYVGADLEALCKEAAMHTLRRVLPDISSLKGQELSDEQMKKLIIKRVDFDYAMQKVEPSALREVLIEIPKVKWSDVGGLEKVKQKLKEVIEWPLKYPDQFDKFNLTPPKGILLYGPPGTGKTLIAKAVANESGANFISVKGPELLSKWVGESEKKLREIFRKAKQSAPSIIFFDEIDAMTHSRGTSRTEVVDTLVSQLLTEMSGIEEIKGVVIMAATNRPDIVDNSLLRPGRFDRHILISAPDEKGRIEILKVHTKNVPVDKNVNLEEIAKKTKNFSGADLESLCKEATMLALRENLKGKGTDKVTKKHFDEVLKDMRPSIPEKLIKSYEDFENATHTPLINKTKTEEIEYTS
ncbi:MAG: AAA family ATPase [Candidatus Aenigmatarchaeota archaeon]|nr:MAG: AAA family ATPase [Candidatus Aenigmarchaeota archaeon]